MRGEKSDDENPETFSEKKKKSSHCEEVLIEYKLFYNMQSKENHLRTLVEHEALAQCYGTGIIEHIFLVFSSTRELKEIEFIHSNEAK